LAYYYIKMEIGKNTSFILKTDKINEAFFIIEDQLKIILTQKDITIYDYLKKIILYQCQLTAKVIIPFGYLIK